MSEANPKVIVNADTIAEGLSAFAPATVAFEAGRIMLRRIRELAGERADFAFETTLAGRSYALWLAGLRREGYEFNLVFLSLRSPDLAVQRVKERVRLGGHDVPDIIVRRRYFKGIGNFFKFYQALADSWGVYDNSSSSRPRFIAKGVGRVVTKIYDEGSWNTFRETGE